MIVGYVNKKGEHCTRPMTEEELAIWQGLGDTNWHFNRPLRVQVPMQLIRENKEKIEFGAVDNAYLSGLLTHMLQTDTIQRKIENDTLYAYFDQIFPDHEAILASVGIGVENRNVGG